MSGVYPTKGQQPGFRGFGIEKDQEFANFRVTNRHQLPAIRSANQPPGHWPGVGGGIAYDIDTFLPYYSDGYKWYPIGAGATGTVESYTFIKNTSQIIPVSVETTISMWEASSLDTYHTIPGWNLISGIYTAFRDEVLTLEVNIAWESGISNLGDRTLRVQHMKFGIPVWNTIKEVSTQADPDMSVETTQECQIHAQISQNDSIRIAVEHDAPVPIVIATGIHTSIAGFRINT